MRRRTRGRRTRGRKMRSRCFASSGHRLRFCARGCLSPAPVSFQERRRGKATRKKLSGRPKRQTEREEEEGLEKDRELGERDRLYPPSCPISVASAASAAGAASARLVLLPLLRRHV